MKRVIAALQALRGIAKVSAVTIVAEVGQLSRFAPAVKSRQKSMHRLPQRYTRLLAKGENKQRASH
jgi:peptide methionine sulfoxide reductase MsrA